MISTFETLTSILGQHRKKMLLSKVANLKMFQSYSAFYTVWEEFSVFLLFHIRYQVENVITQNLKKKKSCLEQSFC